MAGGGGGGGGHVALPARTSDHDVVLMWTQRHDHYASAAAVPIRMSSLNDSIFFFFFFLFLNFAKNFYLFIGNAILKHCTGKEIQAREKNLKNKMMGSSRNR